MLFSKLPNRRKDYQLAEICDNHGEHIGRIERGEYNVTSSTLYMISKAFGITMKKLFDFEFEELA